MLLPLALIAIAILSAAVAVYGTLPHWAVYEHGLQIIEMSRRLQWPLLTLSLILCLTLAVLVITGKRRLWWLIGFAPVLALFSQQFVTGAIGNLRIIEQPTFVQASSATFIADDEYVVGLQFNDQWYAFPYRQLYHCPVIIHSDRDKRIALLWSAFANRATAYYVGRQIKARELDIVSIPANALLIYNGRVGQFINGVTGLTPSGEVPTGFNTRIPTVKTTWQRWKLMHPQTHAMSLPTLSTATGVPLMPQYPMRVTSRLMMPVETPVAMFNATPPLALEESKIGDQFLNVTLGEKPALIFRDRTTGRLRAFERTFGEHTSTFVANFSALRAAKGVVMLDVATNSGWNWNGVAVDGDPDIVGQKLTPVTDFDEDLYLGVMREWYPELELLKP
jgi:Protein of unknown function (DUF3179)